MVDSPNINWWVYRIPSINGRDDKLEVTIISSHEISSTREPHELKPTDQTFKFNPVVFRDLPKKRGSKRHGLEIIWYIFPISSICMV